MSAVSLEHKGLSTVRVGLMVVCVATGIFALMVGAILFARATAPALYVPPEALMPGHTLPSGVQCIWPPFSEKTVHCHITLDHDIYVVYDTSRDVITSTSVSVDEQASIGALILAWGTPTGQRRYTWSTEVQWG